MLRLMRTLADEHTELDEYFRPDADWLEALEVMFLDRMGQPDHLIVVARDEGRVIGMVTACLQPAPVFLRKPRALIENLVVAPERRREGIGRQLVRAAIDWSERKKVAYVELMVAMANEAGREFWQSCEFEPVMLRMQRPGKDGGNG